MKKTVLAVFGTRPEAIKMAAVVKELEKENQHFNLVTCVTGQHREILDQMLSLFEIKPHIDLDLMVANQTLPSLTAKAVQTISNTIEEVKPHVTLVQGDTTTAMSAGLASFYSKVPVGHVEAGLRTANRYDPFPEEINRRILGTLATFHFAPTESSANSLISEGCSKETIFMTGNTVIDALLWTAARVKKPSIDIKFNNSRFILMTAHRRENFGEPIKNICKALINIVKENDIDVVYPVHPNPNIRGPVYSMLGDIENIHLVDPLEYEDFVYMMKEAYLILTDSGGVQEEAPSLGKPVLVLRKTTERPEAVSAGVAKLIGTDSQKIATNVKTLLDNESEYLKMAQASNPFGDGTASKQIVSILKEKLF